MNRELSQLLIFLIATLILFQNTLHVDYFVKMMTSTLIPSLALFFFLLFKSWFLHLMSDSDKHLKGKKL